MSDERERMSWAERERLIIRLVSYFAYVIGALSAAASLSTYVAPWLGPMLVMVAGAIPAGIQWRAQREREENRRAREEYRDQLNGRPVDHPRFGPAPGVPALPSVSSSPPPVGARTLREHIDTAGP